MTILRSVILGSVAALATFSTASAQCTELNGNYYCNSVKQIIYDNVGYSGSYDDVVTMDMESCTCDFSKKSFGGKFAPLDEGLSLHFRGPLHLKQFGVYQPNPSAPKQKREEHVKRHAHHAHHKRGMVTVTETRTVVAVPTPNSDIPKDASVLETNVGEDPYIRTAYYNAESQTADGLVFMNAAGGQGSGVFDNCGGLSISYMSSDTKTGSATPQILNDAPIGNREEFMIFSDEKCDGSCGAYREGIPAYKGFSGTEKIFVFEFSMPEDNSGDDFNRNMPAIWSLNSRIPRTAQYGIRSGPCACWNSGCGELDMFEVLKGGEQYMTSHIHSKQGAVGGYGGGGSPDYFERPTNEFIKAAVVFDGNDKVFISILPSDVTFPKSFDLSFLESLKAHSVDAAKSSTFKLPS